MTKDMRRFAGLFAGLILMACGSSGPPIAKTSPTGSPVPSSQPTPIPTPLPAPTGGSAKVTCSAAPGAAMAVIAGQFLYDVSNPTHPRLVCRTTTTYFHLLEGNAIAYTTVAAKKVYIVRRDLTTGAETSIGRLPADPQGAKSWTSDGSVEVYGTSVPAGNGALISVHLWSNGADHVLYRIESTQGGLESRWSPLPIAEISPDHAYIAISDFNFVIYGNKVRIFSVADQSQKFAAAGSSTGGTWIANDRFVWAVSESLMQWTPTGGATRLRAENWYGPTSSLGGGWMAATLLTNSSKPHVLVVGTGGGQTFQSKALGSGPAFVSPSVVWYAEESAVAGGGATATWPNGNVHALDVTNGSDRVVEFRKGEKPSGTLCCTTRV
jgi:hypothetical protein